MNRREATFALGVLAGVPFVAGAQPTRKPYRLGFLGLASASDYARFLRAFLQGLRELGYEDGRNIAIEYRWAEGYEERLPELASQLVRSNPDIIVSHSIGIAAVQRATSTLPIVMGVSDDPVGHGLIKSLAKPGGNTTGVASQIVEAASKRLELLKEAVPALKALAVLSNPVLPAARRGLEVTERAARTLGIRVRSYGITSDPASLEPTFAAILRERPDGLIVQPDPITGKYGTTIAAFATRHRLPSIGGGKQFAVEGGLASYGANFEESWRMAAQYVDKILRGAKPANLPVEQLATFELVVNLRTAMALNLKLPPGWLARASEVIQ